MIYTHKYNYNKELKIDCKNCFSLCCIALYFSASEGFPRDKAAGKPCVNLKSDFTCSIHENLKDKGLKGCTAYDCLGAGQKVSQITFSGNDWQSFPASAGKMFDAFLVMRQLHEMLWYLNEALILNTTQNIKEEISLLLDNTKQLTLLNVDYLLTLDIASHRNKVNIILKNTSESVRAKAGNNKKLSSKNKSYHSAADYFGANLTKINLKGADLRGACLIAANLRKADLSFADFIGADLRDADIRDANLTNSIFLTQAQINTAKGNSNTKLPRMLTLPSNWVK